MHVRRGAKWREAPFVPLEDYVEAVGCGACAGVCVDSVVLGARTCAASGRPGQSSADDDIVGYGRG